LREANQLYRDGEYQRAVVLYADLAQRAEANGLQQAANLYLRAGIACLKLGEIKQTRAFFQRSFQFCLDRNRWVQLQRVLNVACVELIAAGQDSLKEELYDWLKPRMTEAGETMNTELIEERRTSSVQDRALPAHCPNCGGPVNPKEVDWFDEDNPVCAFCGSILRHE